MATRVPGSMRTRKLLSELIEGRVSSADGRGELEPDNAHDARVCRIAVDAIVSLHLHNRS